MGCGSSSSASGSCVAGSSLSASPALGLGSSLGSFAPAAAAGGKTTKEEKRETTHLNTTHSKQIKGSAAKYSVSPDGHHRVDSTLHDDLRRSEFSNTSLIGVPSGEPTTENDMYRYEPTPLNLLPDPLVSLPIVTFDPLPADLASAAIRSLDTASQVFDLASGGVVQLSKRAEQIIAAEDTNHAHYEHALDECGLESDSDVSSAGTSSVTVASVLKLLARIYSIWNTPLEIPLLQFDPTIQRGSIIGGQLACTPSAYPASGGVPSASPFAPAAHHPFVRTPTNTKIKQDPKPPAVGEYVAYLKLWEGELVRDAHLYMLASHRAHLLAARDSVRIFENLISVAVTRGTFSASVYGQQDLYLLDRHRLESLEPIRAAMKRAALGSAGMGIDRTRRTHSHAHAFNGDILAQSVEEELLHRFSAIRADLSTHALFQSSFDPIDFSLDIAAELNRYIQGTRMAMCRAFWQFIHTNDAMPSYEEEMAEHSEDTLLRPSAAMLLRRVIWIRGASGVGKTCLSALLAEVFYDQMLAVYFVRHDRAARKSPARMIRSIAFQLSQRIPAFADELKVRLAKMARDTQRKQTTTNAETHLTPASMDLQPPIAYLDSLAPLDLFEQLLIQPLAAIKQPQFIAKNKKMVILVDAIDECEEARPGSSVDSVDPVARSSRSCAPVSPLLDNPLLSLLLQQVTRLPTWVGLCITSRPSEHIIRAIAKLRPTEISFESRDNAADLKKIVTTILEPVVAPNQLQQCANVILDKAQGAILYVRLVLDDKLPRLVAGDRVGSAHPTGVTSGHSPLIASKESSIILPVNARDDHPTRPTSPTSANGNANASAGVTLDPRPYSVTHADVSAFPDGLHAYYQDTFDRMAALMTSFKQPIAAVMQLVKLLVCAREPMSPALLAQLQYGSTGSKETAQTLTLRLMQPLRALMPYRVLDSRRVPRGKYSVVHKSVKDWLVDPTRAPLASRTATKKTMPTWFISLQKGHARLAEKCWNALLVKSPFHGSPSDGRAPGVSRGVGADFGAGGDSVHADACVVGAGGVTLSELPNGIIPIRAPMLNIDHAIKHADDTKHESKQDDDEPHSDGTGGMQSQRQILCQDSLLSYALRFGPSHGIASGDLCGTAAFLCHLQYLHMRTSLIGESSLCAIDYINAARQIHANARGWGEMKRNNANGVKLNKSTSAIHTPPCHAIQPESTQPNSWSWLSPADAAIGIIHFQSFYQSELPHWLHRHELIYQYALAFPDATLVCRVARSLVGWYLSEWPHRRMGLVYWNNKPQAIDALQITLRGHERGVTCIAYSPDGLSLASGSIDRSIRIWNGDTGELRTELKGHSYHVNCIAFSPDGKQIASGGSDNQIRLWDTFTGECTRILRGDDVWFHSVEFSPDGRKLCCGVSDWSVWMFDLATFEIDMRLDGHRDKIMDVAYSPDGKIIASASEDETIRIWAAASGRLVHEIREAHNKGVMSLDFDSAGVRLASVGMDGFIRLWSCDDWSLIRCVHAHPKGVIGVEFHPDQIRVVSCSYDRTVKMWNSLDGQLLHTLHGHLEEVNAIACAPNGSLILWDSQLDVTRSSLSVRDCSGVGHVGSIYSVMVSPDGSKMVSCGEDKTIKIWRYATGEFECDARGHKEGVLAASFIADGARIVSGSTDSSIRFWDSSTGTELDLKVSDKTGFVWALAASPDGRQVVSGSTDAMMRVWDTQTGALIRQIKNPKGMIYSVGWSPTGDRIVCGSEMKVVRVYAALTGALQLELAGHTGDIHSVCFSPDGRLIASGSYDRTIGIWDATTGKLSHSLTGHSSFVNSVAFSPNGRLLASAGADATIRVWDIDAHSARQISILAGHTDSVLSVRFNPAGSHLITAGKNRDATIRVWSFAPTEGADGHTEPDSPNPPAHVAAAPRLTVPCGGAPLALTAHRSSSSPTTPIGARMASRFDFRTDRGGLVAGCIHLACHS